MPSYSVSLNAVVSPTGGSIARLDAVCAAGPATNMVVVANTANLAVAGGKFRGVALEAAAGNQAIQIVDFGTVDLLTTVLSGTGDYVSVNATGQLVRTATVTAATIGTLENGTIHVNVALGIGGTFSGSATSIQGVPVSSASAATSYILAGDGTALRSRRAQYNFLDFKIDGVGPDETGVVPCNAHLQLALDTIPIYSELYVPNPSTHFLLDLGTTITVTRPSADVISHPNNDLPTGTPVILESTGSMPAGVTSGVRYYTIRQSASTSKLATSLANAQAGTAIAITTAGTATITMSVTDRVPVIGYDDNEHGNRRGIRIIGEGPGAHSAGKWHFRCRGTRKQGTTAKITARTNGGSGDYHQTVELGAGSGVFAADVERWRGRFFVSYNCATDDNNCDGIIVDVPSDNVVRVSNTNTSATGSDNGLYGSAPSPTICWWIDEPVIDLRGKDWHLQNLGIAVASVGYGGLASKLGALLEFNHPPGTNAQNVIHNHVINCNIETDSHTSGKVRDLVWIARDMLATDSGNFCWRGLNGLGEYQVCHPSQTDTFRFILCNFNMATRSCVAMWSVTGQCKENRFWECQFGAGGIHTSHAVAVPADVKNASWVAAGNAHFDMDYCSFGHLRDACIQTGGYASAEFRITNCYSEACTFALRAQTNSTHNPITLKDCNWLGGTYPASSRSGLFAQTNGAGPLTIEGGFVDGGPDGHDIHIEVNSAQTTREAQVKLTDWWLHGRSDYVRRGAFRVSTFRGPFDFSGGNYWLRMSIDGAADVEAQLTQASFNSACGYTVNLAEVCCEDLAEWVNAQAAFAGAGAWGRGDNAYFYIRTLNLGALGSIQLKASTHGAQTDANDKLGMGTLMDSAGAITQMAKDTSNLIDVTKAAGTTGKTRIIIENVALSGSAADAAIKCNDIDKRYNSGGASGYGQKILENIGGLSGSNGVQPKNFGGQATITGAAVVATVTFATAEDDANYRIGRLTVTPGAGFAAGSTRAYVTNKTVNGFDINLEVAPGGAVANLIDWGIER